MFRTIPCPSSGVLHFTHNNGICHTGLLVACEQDQDDTQFRPDPARKLASYSEELLMMDRALSETCRIQFQNKFENLLHLVGFIIRIYHDARSHERKTTSIVRLFSE